MDITLQANKNLSWRIRILGVAVMLALLLAGLALGLRERSAQSAQTQVGVARLVPQVLEVYPHDPAAYTQGLLLIDGSLYESTGNYARSTVREVEPATGRVIRQVENHREYFGEGLALVGDQLIQITWLEHVAFIYDLETFAVEGVRFYPGAGWGLCYDGQVIWMTNGNDLLYMRDPATFRLLSYMQVTLDGVPQFKLNELECVGDSIYANIYMTDLIVRVDKATGRVTAQIDASNLLTPAEREPLSSGEVLNGIAYDPEEDVFYLTGKHWPKMFKVRFVPQ